MRPGYCRGCGLRTFDTDLCDRCVARMDYEDEHPRRQVVPTSRIHVPFDPETDRF